MNRGAIVHIVGQDSGTREQFVDALSKALPDQGYPVVAVLDWHIAEQLALKDDDLLVRVIGWASQFMSQTGVLVLVSVNASQSQLLTILRSYSPDIETSIHAKEPVTSALQFLSITAEVSKFPQEIAQIILTLETAMTADQALLTKQHLTTEDVYTPEEEAQLKEHLRSLGYL